MKTLTVFNHAGGAGKTSIVRDVGFELAQAGQRVLLIDLDPQASLTKWLGVTDVMEDETVLPVAVDGQPLPTPREAHGLHLIPSHINLSLAEAQISGQIGAVMTLRAALFAVTNQYDVVLIDSPPSLGQLAALGALASDMIVVPVLTSQKGLDALPGLERALEMYRRLRPELRVGLYVPTMYDGRRLHDREVLSALQSSLPGLADPIPFRGAIWMDSTTAGQPVGVYAPNSVQQQDVQRLTRRVLDLLEVSA
ncbi:ParA family protein [Deinococcus humi]|uniref:Chromosome partitioning protein n=1 Tax=Deinococcus humi TaxID=662880 RepID=A0A7W8NI11_9DEIO|nr:ParA family protein [Deinococcus humi]MBB5364592.1 chromosome partitioning protein [Deinococcus humi]GGO41306.1 chromosome partitioning protein ParA [Deinococcus humi]